MTEKKSDTKHNSSTGNRTFGKEAVFFLLVMVLAFYTMLKGQNLSEIWQSIRQVSPWFLLLSGCSALLFVSGEGFMIWYLLKAFGEKNRISRCIGYSFIGFFYSGITPSATGGQPMQLYYMQKDKNSVPSSTVVLMVVAVMYKFVLVVVGALLFVVWKTQMQERFGNYFWLFLLGLFLNIVLVILIAAVMLFPNWMIRVSGFVLRKLEKRHVVREAQSKLEKVTGFVENYRQAVLFLKAHPGKLGIVFLVTLLQRSSLFFMTWFLYCGFGLQGASIGTVVALQASVYVAVDMLPIPGAQGITEVVFKKVFTDVIAKEWLIPVMLVSRGINFYFLFLISMVLSVAKIIKRK